MHDTSSHSVYQHDQSSHYDHPPVTCTIHPLIMTSTINLLIMTGYMLDQSAHYDLLHARSILSDRNAALPPSPATPQNTLLHAHHHDAKAIAQLFMQCSTSQRCKAVHASSRIITQSSHQLSTLLCHLSCHTGERAAARTPA